MENLKKQLFWEKEYNNLQEYTLLQDDLIGVIPEEIDPRERKILAKILVQVYLHKRMNIPTIVGCIRNSCASAEEASALVVKCINNRWVLYDFSRKEITVRYIPDNDIIEKLDQFQFPPPLLCKPKPIKKNTDSAYYTIKVDNIILNQRYLPKEKKIDACLDHINRMNQVVFKLNLDVVEAIENHWEGTLHPKEGESLEDFQKKERAFAKYNRNAHKLIKMIVDAGNRFYLAHHYDKRGRINSQGYYINYQGNDWCKGCIEFADEEYLNDD